MVVTSRKMRDFGIAIVADSPTAAVQWMMDASEGKFDMKEGWPL